MDNGHQCANTDSDSPMREQIAMKVAEGSSEVQRASTFTCSSCGRAFTLCQKLFRHQRTMHWGGVFPCENCGKTFSRMDNLIRHSKTHRSSVNTIPANRDSSKIASTMSTTGTDEIIDSTAGSQSSVQHRSVISKTAQPVPHSQTQIAMMGANVTPSTSRAVDHPPGFSRDLNGSCQQWRNPGTENIDLMSYLHSQDHRGVLQSALKDLKCVKFFYICAREIYTSQHISRGWG